MNESKEVRVRHDTVTEPIKAPLLVNVIFWVQLICALLSNSAYDVCLLLRGTVVRQ